MPGIVDVESKFSELGVKFVGVNMDDDKKAAKKFMKQINMDWPQIWDQKIGKRLGIKAIPTSVLISPDGKIIEAGSGTTVASRMRYHLE